MIETDKMENTVSSAKRAEYTLAEAEERARRIIAEAETRARKRGQEILAETMEETRSQVFEEAKRQADTTARKTVREAQEKSTG
jgi:vacuolar-type H+-ATPase subunit H